MLITFLVGLLAAHDVRFNVHRNPDEESNNMTSCTQLIFVTVAASMMMILTARALIHDGSY